MKRILQIALGVALGIGIALAVWIGIGYVRQVVAARIAQRAQAVESCKQWIGYSIESIKRICDDGPDALTCIAEAQWCQTMMAGGKP